jgi:integrase
VPKNAEGELRETDDGFAARITIRGKHRKTFPLPTCRTRDEAIARRNLLAELAQRFRKAGVIDTLDAKKLLETAASCAPALLAGVREVAGELVGGELVDADAPAAPTFAELAKDWTDGTLHKRYPDHVKSKDSALDESRLEKLCAIDVGGMTLGGVPLDRFRIDHAEAAMRALPAEAKRPATRRAYAQLIHRVLGLAVYPCRVLEAHPLPKGFVPKIGKPPAFAYLYPSEDAALLASSVPLAFRLLWGFLCREGCRTSEAAGLRFRDLDLKRGTLTLDENKTDDARAWALDPGVAAALATWKKQRDAGNDDLVFVDPQGQPLEGWRLAGLLRAHLKAAGVERAELFAEGANRRPLRAHDLRGTFVTLSLANGRSETWVADRTGHTSSQMINRYRRAARSATELDLGSLLPLNAAIPELSADCPAIAPNARSLGQDERPKPVKSKSGSTGTRTQDQRIKNPLL